MRKVNLSQVPVEENPDSDKWGLPSNLNGPVLKGKAVDDFEGEE